MKVKAIGTWSMGPMSVQNGQMLDLSEDMAASLMARGYAYEIKPEPVVAGLSQAAPRVPKKKPLKKYEVKGE